MLLLASYGTGVMEMNGSIGDYRERRFVGLALVAIMVSVPLGGVIPASADSSETEDHGPINLAIILHMHQPYYKNIESGFYELPWVRVHGSHEYIDSPGILGMYPGTNVTYNIVPSLIEQLEDYSDPSTMDLHLALAKSNWITDGEGYATDYPTDLSEWELAQMMFEYFRIQPWVYDVDGEHPELGWMEPASSSFGALKDGRDNSDPSFVRAYQAAPGDSRGPKSSVIFHPQHLLDATVLFHLFQNSGPLVMGDYDYLLAETAASAEMQSIFEKEAPYTVSDLETVLSYQSEQMLNVMPLYSNLANTSQVELTTTPKYHPIMPLLAMPGWTMEDGIPVEKDAWISDVEEQVSEGLDLFEASTGIRPSGMWPSEQAVSQAVIAPMAENGIQWAVSDKQVLSQSVKLGGGNPSDASTMDITSPWMVESGGQEMMMVFRETGISDRIAFTYGDMDVEDAVADFISQVENRRSDIINAGGNPEDHLLTVAADGENWLFMSGFGSSDNGREFLHEWFDALQDHPTIRTMTPGQYLEEKGTDQLPRLEELATGSWIQGDLSTWAGEEEESIGWHRLVAARDVYMQVLNEQPNNPGLPAAKHALMAAQGSDWFWWYGADQDSGDDSQFDALFRTHLRTIYESLGVGLPPDLLDLSGNVATPTRPSSGLMEPFYDGLSFPGEWNSAAEYDAGSGSGAADITSIEIGHDTGSIHLKIGVGDIDSYLDPDSYEGGTPHIQIYLMAPNAVDNNVAQANFHTYYGMEPLNMPTTKMLWFDFNQLRSDGRMTYNTFQSQGNEEWSIESQGALGLIVADEVFEVEIPWSTADLEPNGFTRLRIVSSVYQSRAAGGGADIELAPTPPMQISMPNLESWVKILDMQDPTGDETGDGDYTYPLAGDFAPGAGLFDLEHAIIEQSAWNVRFTFTMAEITNNWNMMWGWSHANIQIYVDSAPGGNQDLLPGTYAKTSPEWGWESAVMLVGEAGPVYGMTHESSTRITTGIEAQANPETNTIVATISKSIIGGDLATSRFLIVVGSQDGYGEGKLRAVDETASTWVAGGGAPANPTNLQKYHSSIWDVLLPESVDQGAMLNSYDVNTMTYAELHGLELPPIEQQVYGLTVSEVTGNSALLTWSSAKSGQMEVRVAGNGADVVDETWASSSSDHVYVISGMSPGEDYTVTISADGVSVSASFATPEEVDTEAPEILGAEYEVDDGAYHLTFFTTEPSSIVVEVCTDVQCSSADIGDESNYPTEQVHRYSLAVPVSNHTVMIHAMDAAGNDASMLLIESGTISDTQVNDGTQNGNGTDTGGDNQGSETNSPITPLILVVIALAAAILVLQGTRRPSSDDMEDGHSDAEMED
ncbi:MAG: glucodextranase DOMON-like domain-containing protein [Candidatus Thalassarchaeaceae archaeon]